VISGDAEEQSSTPSLKPSEPVPGRPDPIPSNPTTEVLLELAEECPLSPSLLLTASPMDVNPVIGTPKLSKSKSRARVSSTESKKRRSRRSNSNNRTCITAASDTSNTSTKASSAAVGDEPLVNG